MALKRTAIFPELTGIRIYLALIVALTHALQISGYNSFGNPFVAQVMNGSLYVRIFMILSGFVITHLLLARREAYAPFIVRRFFRLYPALALWCAIGWFLSEISSAMVAAAPWRGAQGWAEFAGVVQLEARELATHPVQHFLAHATMLHGLIPNEVLDHSATTALAPAWSISLEWQFYLIAPFVMGSIKKPWLAASLLMMFLGIYFAADHGKFGTYPTASSLTISAPYFVIGICSKLFLRRLSDLRLSAPLMGALAIALAFMISKDPLGLSIWGCFYSYMLWGDSRLFDMLFKSRLPVLLGECSYLLYLAHLPVLTAITVANVFVIGQGRIFNVALCVAGIAALVPLSVVLFRVVEKPGERFGRRIAEKVSRKPVTPLVSA